MAEEKRITNYRITEHAREEMVRRQISEEDVAKVLANPEQAEKIRTGREVYQSRLSQGEPSRVLLLRVFLDVDRVPPEVVTVYRTSKVAKYWRKDV